MRLVAVGSFTKSTNGEDGQVLLHLLVAVLEVHDIAGHQSRCAIGHEDGQLNMRRELVEDPPVIVAHVALVLGTHAAVDLARASPTVTRAFH